VLKLQAPVLGELRLFTRLGPSRRFAAAQQFSRFRSEADIQRASPEPDLLVRALVSEAQKNENGSV
jgi:hypothetical protein